MYMRKYMCHSLIPRPSSFVWWQCKVVATKRNWKVPRNEATCAMVARLNLCLIPQAVSLPVQRELVAVQLHVSEVLMEIFVEHISQARLARTSLQQKSSVEKACTVSLTRRTHTHGHTSNSTIWITEY